LLHARGEMRGLPHRAVVHAQIAGDRPHDDLTGVETDPNLDRCARRAMDLRRVPRDRLLHPERGVAGAHCVVLMSDRRPEEGHDTVAHDLVDGALVSMDGFHHVLAHRVQELTGLLWVPFGQQLH
jgi:hypothetical protein